MNQIGQLVLKLLGFMRRPLWKASSSSSFVFIIRAFWPHLSQRINFVELPTAVRAFTFISHVCCQFSLPDLPSSNLLTRCAFLAEWKILVLSFLALPWDVNTPAGMPAASITWCLEDAPELNCNTADIAAISTDLGPLNRCFGALFHTRLFKLSLTFWEYPGRQRSNNEYSLRHLNYGSNRSKNTGSKWWSFLSSVPCHQLSLPSGQNLCLSFGSISSQEWYSAAMIACCITAIWDFCCSAVSLPGFTVPLIALP